MKEEIREELRRFGNWIFIGLSLLSVGLGIGKLLPPKDFMVVFLILLTAYLISYIYRLRTQLRDLHTQMRENPPPPSVIQLLKKNIPSEIEFLAEFLASTVLHDDVLPVVKFMDRNLHVIRLTKNFTVKQYDCITEEIYEVENASSSSHANGVQVLTSGGSSLQVESLNVDTYEIKNGSQRHIIPRLEIDKERLKIYLLPFTQALPYGKSSKVIYKDFWPNCMRYGEDALFYSETLFYEHNVDQIESQVTLDGNVTYIRAYSYDLDLHRWELDESQPMPHSTEKGVYIWKKSHPASNKIYLIAFNRIAHPVESE